MNSKSQLHFHSHIKTNIGQRIVVIQKELIPGDQEFLHHLLQLQQVQVREYTL